MVVAQLPAAVDHGAGAGLVLVLNRGRQFVQLPSGVLPGDLFQALGPRVGPGVLAARLTGRVIRADDQAGDRVAVVADLRDVPPGVGGVRGVDADRITVNAAAGLAG